MNGIKNQFFKKVEEKIDLQEFHLFKQDFRIQVEKINESMAVNKGELNQKLENFVDKVSRMNQEIMEKDEKVQA